LRILHLDKNHELLVQQLTDAGHENVENYTISKTETEKIIADFDGIVIRSRFKIGRSFLDAATQLKFIARVGAGLESIDIPYAQSKGVHLISAPEGNRNAVGEHTLGMILALFNKLKQADNEIRLGKWNREANRGLEQLQKETDVLSLHTPWTSETDKMINTAFIETFAKPFFFINTARGKSVVTEDLVTALEQGKIVGAGLDVLEYEKGSFETLFTQVQDVPEALTYLLQSPKVLLSPHIAGWTVESKRKLAQIVVDKILAKF